MTTLIPVVVKRDRRKCAFKYWGALLNPAKRYYVRRLTSKANPLTELNEIKGATQ